MDYLKLNQQRISELDGKLEIRLGRLISASNHTHFVQAGVYSPDKSGTESIDLIEMLPQFTVRMKKEALIRA